MEEITKEILNYLNNKHTKVEEIEDFDGNYYNYITDTIYLSKTLSEKKQPKSMKNLNPKIAKLIMVCHECLHSVQNKYLHICNIVLSNMSIVLLIVCILLEFLNKSVFWISMITIGIILVSIIVRIVLEFNAINNSTKLARKFVGKNEMKDISEQDIESAIEYVNRHKYFAVLQMVFNKIVSIFLVLILK